ncbi:MAG: L,D-transpeptidase [Xanthobacteraceae bacterium]|nr:MAG: L,D-transpeptidase [Xanthobacteraceae bacterium]
MAIRNVYLLAASAFTLGVLAAGFPAPSAHAQGYPPPPYAPSAAPPPAYPPAYGQPGQVTVEEDPDFNAIEDSDPARGASALPPPGPVLSPNDPRYGRPAAPPPVYSERGPGFIYPDDNRAPEPVPPPRAQSLPPAQPMPPANVGAPDALRPPAAIGSTQAPAGPNTAAVSILPPEDQPETGTPEELPPQLRRQEVNYPTKEPAGTIIVDTAHTQLYFVLGGGRALRYGIRVGRDGFRWSGTQKITRKVEWPDWHPPAEMIERQPYLPRFMAGGPGNPLGARALYLGNTVYRIHGTNQPSTIGKRVSSGCFGLLNEDVSDLFERVKLGTKVVILPGGAGSETAAAPQAGAPQPLSAPQGGPYVPGQSGAANTSGGPITSAPLPPPPQR